MSHDPGIRRLFAFFGWELTDEFRRRYQRDAHLYHVMNAALILLDAHDRASKIVDAARRARPILDREIAETTCTKPGYGAPGVDHCAVCCGGTLVQATNQEDYDLAVAVRDLAAALDEWEGT